MPDASDGPDSAVPAVVAALPTRPKPTRRQVMLRGLLLASILGLVFLVILPRIVDYDAVLGGAPHV